MRARPFVRLAVISAFVAASILSGCGQKGVPIKPPPGGGGPPSYPVLSSPQNVLSALGIAYTSSDSMETKAVYDSTYEGTSEDLSDPASPPPLSFHYFDEVRHVAVLARNQAITSIHFQIGSPTTWTRLESDDASHPEWAVISIYGYRISVVEGATEYRAEGTNPFIFKFKPSTPESSSPTDTLWKIIRWTEVRSY